MIVVRITGGLGNQMFQYAFARTLQKQRKKILLQWHGHRTKSRHNGWELDDVFAMPLSEKIRAANHSPLLNMAAWGMRKTSRKREPKNTGFSPECLNETHGYLDGYWQSEKYFSTIEETIRSDFCFNPLQGEDNLDLQKRMASEPCVSVHVRRGDYLNHSGLGTVCDSEYYKQALDKMDSTHPGCTLIVFSDDIPYCRELFANRKALFVDWNQGENSWMDMALMSLCHHHIIANSSFSWWGAWLGATVDCTTMAPKKWYTETSGTANPHICPEHWIRIG